jgi:hypothetical protein
MRYRLFLYDADNHIRAAEAYHARNDRDAVEIGAAVQSASADQFERFEVWRGSEWIKDSSWRSAPTSIELIVRHQDMVLEVEERLSCTFESIRRSRNLMATLHRLHEERWHRPPPT